MSTGRWRYEERELELKGIKPSQFQFNGLADEPVICPVFGCGKPAHNVKYNDRCVEHQRPTMIDINDYIQH